MGEKLNDAREELDIVTRLNEMLVQNESDWQDKVTASAEELHRVTLTMQQEKSAMEGEVAALMERLAAIEAAESDAPTGEGEEEEDMALARLSGEAATNNTTYSEGAGTSSG